jgi:ParB family chromosome partitioning protein
VAQQRRGLGRGLGALIPESPRLADGDAAREPDLAVQAAGSADSATAPAEVFGAHYKEIAISAITPNPRQPRRSFDEESLDELAESIRQVGLLQPVVVRAAGPGRYGLIMGERRWRACQRAGLTEIGAIVKQTQDNELLRDALIENLHRQQLDPLEEAAAYQQLIEDFGLTHDEVAARVGRSRATVTNTLRLMQLPPAIQKYVQDGKLSNGHARALLGTPDRAFQELLAKRIVAEDLSVRATEEAIREHQGERAGGASSEADGRGTAASGARKLRAPGLVELEELLGDHLETRVKISMGASRGKVVVEFSTLEDLERIYRRITDGTRS